MADIKVETNKSAAPPKKSPTPVADIRKDRTEGVNGIFQLAGLGCIMMGQLHDAGAISIHGPAISNEIVTLAESDARIAKGVDALLQVGPYAGLVAAVMPLVLQLLANHKVVPADKLGGAGIQMPDALEMQVKTQMQLQALEIMRQRQAVEDELQMAQQEWDMAQAARNGNTPE
jgi:hypothetical protein